MKTLLSLCIASTLTALPALAAPSETWVTERASFNFETIIRVKIPAQIVEAEDARIVGESAGFVQSLLYTANKGLEYKGSFQSEAEVKSTILKELCPSQHEVVLVPVRNEGAKGDREFAGKIKPFTVSLTGKTIKADSVKPFTVFLVCGKKI